jgi:hypothetical protein
MEERYSRRLARTAEPATAAAVTMASSFEPSMCTQQYPTIVEITAPRLELNVTVGPLMNLKDDIDNFERLPSRAIILHRVSPPTV